MPAPLLSRFQRGFLILAAVGSLAACSAKEEILPGERIAIIDVNLEEGLTPDPEALAEGPALGPALANPDFPTPGYNDGHAGGHLALDLPLRQVFSLKVGRPADDGSELAQPVADEKAVYAVMPGGVVTSVDRDSGEINWQIDIDDSTDETQTSISGGLGIERDILFAHAGKNAIYAINRQNGAVLWSKSFPEFLLGGPTISSGVVVVTDVNGRIYALAALDGEQVWNRIGARGETRMVGVAYPAVIENEIIFAGGDGELISLTLDQGRFNWGENLSPVSLLTALDSISDITAHPVHDGGLVFAVTQSGLLAVYNARTGRLVWEKRLRGATMPWLAGKTVYVTTLNGYAFALRRNDGAVRWRKALPGAFNMAEPVSEDAIRYTNPVVVSGMVVIASETGAIHVLDAATGAEASQLNAGGGITTAPVVAGKTLYLLSRNGRLSAWR
ncbi:MAG: PQQ-binding-like beta-propeller repeat protein [Candidatus Puniceispirillales bacterium]